MSKKFEQIMKIFQELSGTKTAADTKTNAEESLKEHKAGKHDNETSKLLRSMYGENAIDRDDSAPNTKQVATAATTDARYPLEGDSDVTRKIIEGETDIEDYKKVASLDDVSLRQLFIQVSNSVINGITSGDAASQPNSNKQASYQNQARSPQNNNAGQTKSASDPWDDVAFGIVYGLQKQAEQDAESVGLYLYNYLTNYLQQAAAAMPKQAADEEKEKEESKAGPKEEEPVSKERKLQEINGKNGSEEEEKVPPTEKEEDEKSLSAEEAEQALKAMEGENDMSEDEILNNLGQALTELGISSDQLAESGPAGAKLASAFKDFQRKGKFRIEPITSRKKRAAVDYIKEHIIELMNRSNV